MSETGGNPSINNIEAVAHAIGMTTAEFLTHPDAENKQNRQIEQGENYEILSPQGRRLIERLSDLDRQHRSPPALYALIENALDLVHPIARGGDYADLTHAIENDPD